MNARAVIVVAGLYAQDMIKWLGGTTVGIIALIIVVKYPGDVEQLVISFLQLCEKAADGVVGAFRQSQTGA